MKWLFASISLIILVAGFSFVGVGSAQADTGWAGIVTTTNLNVRSAPNTSSDLVGTLNYGDKVTVLTTVAGEAVNGSINWYQIGDGQYIYGQYVGQATATAANLGTGERWIDVSRTNHTARAMVGNNVVYTAEVTVGRPTSPTPIGTFSILRRVANETMNSETVGIPRNSKDGYFYTGVLYTQYFLPTGQAFHYNYWIPDEAFGSWSSSRGCVGLRLNDAKFFWDFAQVGTRVVIHD